MDGWNVGYGRDIIPSVSGRDDIGQSSLSNIFTLELRSISWEEANYVLADEARQDSPLRLLGLDVSERPQDVLRDGRRGRQVDALRMEAVLVGGVGQHDRYAIVADPRGRPLHRLAPDAALLRLDAVAGRVLVRVGAVRFKARLVRQDVGRGVVGGGSSKHDGNDERNQANHLHCSDGKEGWH
uniref:Uncharacterized protein n=1 Tax=Anopheles atroparvus TaxID=41427 RepID=A0A182J1P2_ANOAO